MIGIHVISPRRAITLAVLLAGLLLTRTDAGAYTSCDEEGFSFGGSCLLGWAQEKARSARDNIVSKFRDGIVSKTSGALAEPGRRAREAGKYLFNLQEKSLGFLDESIGDFGTGRERPTSYYDEKVGGILKDGLIDGGDTLKRIQGVKFGIIDDIRDTVDSARRQVKGVVDRVIGIHDDGKALADHAYRDAQHFLDDGDEVSAERQEFIASEYEESLGDYSEYVSNVDSETFVGEDPEFLKEQVFGSEETHREFEYEIIEESFVEAGLSPDQIYLDAPETNDPYFRDRQGVYENDDVTGEVSWVETDPDVFECNSNYCDPPSEWIDLDPDYAYGCGWDECNESFSAPPDRTVTAPATTRDDVDLDRQLAGLVNDALANSERDSREFNRQLDGQFQLDQRLDRAAAGFERDRATRVARSEQEFANFMQEMAQITHGAMQGYAAARGNYMGTLPGGGSTPARDPAIAGGHAANALNSQCTPVPPACQAAQDRSAPAINRLGAGARGAGQCELFRRSVRLHQIGIQANRQCLAAYRDPACRAALQAQIQELQRALDQSRLGVRSVCTSAR